MVCHAQCLKDSFNGKILALASAGIHQDGVRLKLQTCSLLYCLSIHLFILRSVEHQSVPLALDVIVLRLLSDIQAIKLQLSGQLLLSFEDNQRDLKCTDGTVNNLHEI